MSGVVSPTAGTRTEPRDGYQFVRGTTATFKIIFTNNGRPSTVDTGTYPQIKILKPVFLTPNTSGIPVVVDTINGTLVPNQDFEYQFSWDIPLNTTPSDEYIVSYYGTLGNIYRNYGDEFFTISDSAGSLDIQTPYYATTDDIRMMKFNIDSYLPEVYKQSLTDRNKLITFHISNASNKLREELALFGQKMNTPNFKLYTTYQAIYTILLASRGEDGSSVSDQNLIFWRTEAERVLAQCKRKLALGQGLPLGRG